MTFKKNQWLLKRIKVYQWPLVEIDGPIIFNQCASCDIPSVLWSTIKLPLNSSSSFQNKNQKYCLRVLGEPQKVFQPPIDSGQSFACPQNSTRRWTRWWQQRWHSRLRWRYSGRHGSVTTPGPTQAWCLALWHFQPGPLQWFIPVIFNWCAVRHWCSCLRFPTLCLLSQCLWAAIQVDTFNFWRNLPFQSSMIRALGHWPENCLLRGKKY